MTIVHLLRHGEVHNPQGILYGRADGYHLSTRGKAMAERIGQSLGDRDITHILASPLERAQETAAPLAAARGLEVGTEPRIIESENYFAGRPFAVMNSVFFAPSAWPKLVNPFRPSWGEPYKEVAARMWSAVEDARDLADGHEVVLVSHQLPIWVTRLYAEGRRFLHDPRKRQCTLCSVTSLEFDGDELKSVSYSEPAGDLIPVADRKAAFSSGSNDDPALPEDPNKP